MKSNLRRKMINTLSDYYDFLQLAYLTDKELEKEYKEYIKEN